MDGNGKSPIKMEVFIGKSLMNKWSIFQPMFDDTGGYAAKWRIQRFHPDFCTHQMSDLSGNKIQPRAVHWVSIIVLWINMKDPDHRYLQMDMMDLSMFLSRFCWVPIFYPSPLMGSNPLQVEGQHGKIMGKIERANALVPPTPSPQGWGANCSHGRISSMYVRTHIYIYIYNNVYI